MNDALQLLLAALPAARDRQTAIQACLGAILQVSHAAAERSPFKRGQVLRAMLHLRPDEGYAGLAVLEAGAQALTPPSAGQGLLPSASVARLVREGGQPAAVDVTLRIVHRDGSYDPTRWMDSPDAEDLPEGSQVRLMKRDATHLLVLPLPGPGGIIGLVSVEAICRDAIGTPYIWPAISATLTQLLTVAGPYLAQLPARPTAPQRDPLLPVVGPTMAPLIEVLGAFAAEEETLLIRGETGVGKSRIARWCHSRSVRADAPFEVVDLLSVPAETQMGELFGWKRGAFTGAIKDHDGFVARADGGTLFIDEVDKLSLQAQAALLTLIEERRYRVLGDAGDRRVANVRFIVGTNADLLAEVEAGRFREDLYYRIDVLPMTLPPLRERADEIPDWARFMVARRLQARGSGPSTVSDEAAAWLAKHPWPGNLRQLDNVLRRAATLAGIRGGDTIELSHVEMSERLSRGGRPGPSGRSGDCLDALRQGIAAVLGQLATDGTPAEFGAVDLPGALHGLLLAEAVVLTGSWDDAFTLLGRDSLVANRNHHKVMRRDWKRAQALLAALGQPTPAAWVDVIDP